MSAWRVPASVPVVGGTRVGAAVTFAVLGATVAYLMRSHDASAARSNPGAGAMAKAGDWLLMVRLKVREGSLDEVLEKARVLSEHVERVEDGAVAYEFLVSDKEEDVLLVYERYRSKALLADPHQRSEPFKAFKKYLADSEVVVDKSGESYIASNVGFGSRS